MLSVAVADRDVQVVGVRVQLCHDLFHHKRLIDAAHEFDYTEEALRNALYAGQAKQAEGGSEVEIRQAMVLYGRLGKGVVRLTRGEVDAAR